MYDTNIRGASGEDGTDGLDGARGSLTYSGTAITGTSTTPTAYATGITSAIVNDRYQYNGVTEADIGNVYRCTLGGNDEIALWVYDTNIRGADGTDGEDGLSAYAVAANNGFTGTEAEWLASLHGAVRGSLTYSGTAITGTSTTPTAYATGITSAIVNDRYQYNGVTEADIGNVYRCTTAGDESTALWVYDTNIRGASGEDGTDGLDGARGSLTYSGTAITGTSTTPTAYATGITSAIVNDRYQYNGVTEADIGNVYRCTTAGDESTALWVYDLNQRCAMNSQIIITLAASDSASMAGRTVVVKKHRGWRCHRASPIRVSRKRYLSPWVHIIVWSAAGYRIM